MLPLESTETIQSVVLEKVSPVADKFSEAFPLESDVTKNLLWTCNEISSIFDGLSSGNGNNKLSLFASFKTAIPFSKTKEALSSAEVPIDFTSLKL